MNKIVGFDVEFNSLLNNLNNDNLSNSLLLTGNKGIGKSYFLLKLIEEFIKIKITNNQLNHHISLLYNYSHPNIKIIKKEIDEKTKKIKNFITIDQIRKLNQFSIETSIIDNFPNTLLEAMSCNLPCVAFNCYGMKEIITHKKNGYLAKPYSAEDFIKGIDYSLKRQKTLSQESRKYVVNNFKNEKINNKYYKYFKKIKFIK